MADPRSAFEDYRREVLGLCVSHAWRGYGTAIFLEFGRLSPRTKRDGTTGNPCGIFTLMIEWSWRVEESEKIAFGSWSDDSIWEAGLSNLIGQCVTDVDLFGRLPELQLSLSNKFYLMSFMTAEGDPAWALIDHRENGLPTIKSQSGRVTTEAR